MEKTFLSLPSSIAADLLETRGGRSALCLLSFLLLSATTLPPLPSSSLRYSYYSTEREEKNLIQLFRSASPNFLSRPLALELRGRDGEILAEEEKLGQLTRITTTPHASGL